MEGLHLQGLTARAAAVGAALLLALAAPRVGAVGLGVGGSLGGSLPTDELAEDVRPGASLGPALELEVGGLSLVAEGLWSSLSTRNAVLVERASGPLTVPASDVTFDLLQGTVHARVPLTADAPGSWGVALLAGVGYYRESLDVAGDARSSSSWGANVGYGLARSLGPHALHVDGRVHYLFDGEPEGQGGAGNGVLFTLTFGYLFKILP